MTFKNKIVYYLELLIPESMKSLWSTETKTENHEIVPHLEITAVVLLYCNIVNNDYYQDSRFLYLFVSNKLFGSLYLYIKSHIFLKAFKSEFQEIEAWFTDQNSHPLEKKIILILFSNIAFIKMRYSIVHRYRKGYGILWFPENIGTHSAKNMSNNKYSQNLVDSAKKSAADARKTAS